MRVKLGMPMRLAEISYAVNGRAKFNGDPLIEYVSTDSREAMNGDLFIPLKGGKFDGESFVDTILHDGCYAISSTNKNAHILVSNSAQALLDFAAYYNKNLPYILYRIGITGSVGKTTTKEFTRVLLSEGFKVHANEGNFNNEIGLPMSILSAPKNSQILIMEMGMNHPGEIERLSKCLCPDMAVITNIGTSHIGNLGSRENIAKAKLEIERGMTEGRLYVPKEEPLLFEAKTRVSLSLTERNADFYLESCDKKISLYRQGQKCTDADFIFSEEHLKKCLLCACAIAIDTGISPDALSHAISSISIDNIRQKRFSLGGYLFFDDSYNASPESILASFDSIKNAQENQEKSLLLGDVLELGQQSECLHYEIGRSIPIGLFSRLFLFGNFAKYIAQGAIYNGFPPEKIHINTDLERPHITAGQIKKYCPTDSLILMKASRGVRLERVLEYFGERSKEK